MSHILVAGLEPRFADALGRRLSDVTVSTATRLVDLAPDAVACDLLIVDQSLGWTAAEEFIRRSREAKAGGNVAVVATLEADADRTVLVRLVNELGVSQFLFKPIDEAELLRQVSSLLGVALAAPEAVRTPEQQVLTSMAALWERFKDATIQRVGVLEEATAAALKSELDPELRLRAEREAHKLMGSLGTFGFAEGSRLAAEVDKLIRPGSTLGPAQAMRLSELLVALRQELTHSPVSPRREVTSVPVGGPRLLVVEDDAELSALLAAEGRARGFVPVQVADLAGARQAIAAARPEAILLDLNLEGAAEDGRRVLAEAAAQATPIPVVVLTGKQALLDRVEVARLGGAAYLHKPMPASEVLDAVAHVLDRRKEEAFTVLAVDDDPHVLAAVRELAAPRGVKVVGLADPLQFWTTLEEVQPDLVMLDVDMPFVSGIELCRVLRNDLRWGGAPVLFLTARTDPDTVQRVYGAGADDYVSKPIVGPELLGRMLNRLERAHLTRRLSDTDPLTGVASRGRASAVLQHFLRLGDRHQQVVSVAVLAVDGFKATQDRQGATAADLVLRRLGELATRSFRDGDVVARWGAEEFLVGFYASSREDARRRIEELLAAFRAETFTGAEGAFSASFSAGIAASPDDGAELTALHLAADQALYAARAQGPGHVGAAEGPARVPGRS